MSKPKIILDCDPGHDDAVALLLAAHYTDLLGVTTVNGNVPLDLTTHNALITLQIAELELPVHAGAARPLLAEPRHAEFIHGESGLGGPTLPRLTREVASHDAVRFIVETAEATDGLWLVATGPLTNIALALRTAPELAQRLAGISVMGGSSTFGNVTPSAEFNIWADPEAAAIVFGSGVRLLMSGLNLTHQFMVRPPDVARLRAAQTRTATFVADMLDYYIASYADVFFGRKEGPMHDPCALLALSHPQLFEFGKRRVEVELCGTFTRGRTVVDERQRAAAEAVNAEVAYRLDAEKALEATLRAVESFP